MNKTSNDFKSEKSFDLHEKTHLEEQVVCPDCNKKFKTKNMRIREYKNNLCTKKS